MYVAAEEFDGALADPFKGAAAGKDTAERGGVDLTVPQADGTEMVYTTDERLYMVSTIRYVDEVVTYKDVDVDIKGIDFDVFAVGQDQNHAGFQRAMQWCREQGKEVVVLARTEGISSTILRNYSKTK